MILAKLCIGTYLPEPLLASLAISTKSLIIYNHATSKEVVYELENGDIAVIQI